MNRLKKALNSKKRSFIGELLWGRPSGNYRNALRELAWADFYRTAYLNHYAQYSDQPKFSFEVRVVRWLFNVIWDAAHPVIKLPERTPYDPDAGFSVNGCWIIAGPFEAGGCFDISPPPNKPFTVWPNKTDKSMLYPRHMNLDEVKKYIRRLDESGAGTDANL